MTFKELYKLSPLALKQIVMDQWKAKQNPQFHPEGNTLKHIIVVTNRAHRQFPDNKNVQLAAYFHDLGKLATAGINPKTNQPTAYGHEDVSIKLVDQFSDFIQQQGADPDVVKFIVSNHMKVKPSTWDVMKQQKKDPIQNNPNFSDLEKFSTIDKGGLVESNKSNMEFYRILFLTGDITEGVYKRLLSELNFKASPDEDAPGNKQFVCFQEDEKYSVEGSTHSGLSHAIKHYGEFKPQELNNLLDEVLQYIKSTSNPILKNINGSVIASGEAAKKQLTPKTILNTLDFINDKIVMKQELTPEEKQIQDRFLSELSKDYEQLVSSYVQGGVDVEGKSEDEIKKLIDSNKKIEFKGSYKGAEVEYVLDFSTAGILAKRGDNISTLFRIDKQGNSMEKIKQYLSRGVEISNPQLKKILSAEVAEAYKSPKTELQGISEQFRRMQKLAGILAGSESAKDKVLDFLYSDEIKQDTGVSDYVMSDDSDWDRVKDYINGKGISGVTAKQVFLNRNEDVSEQDFEKYYDEWLDYIEDERNMESRNRQDFDYGF